MGWLDFTKPEDGVKAVECVCVKVCVCVEGGHGRRYGFQGAGKQRVKGEWPEEGERITRIIFQGLEEGQTGKRAGCGKSNKTQVFSVWP